VLTEVRLRDAWILFGLALIPAAIVAVLGLRALRNEEAAIRREAAVALESNAARVVAAIDRALESDDAPFADRVILDGSLSTTRTTVALPAAPAECKTNHARDFVLSSCEHARTESGRFLWPIVAMDPPESDARIAAWVRTHLPHLSNSERAAMRADAERIGARETQALLTPGDPEFTLDPEMRAAIRGGATKLEGPSFVARVRRLPDGRFALLIAHASRIAAHFNVKIASAGEPGATFVPITRTFGVLARTDAAELDRRAARSRRVLLVAAITGVALAMAFAAVAIARLRREQRSAALRTDFVSTVSHELRTPLASLRMLAELLEENRVPEEERAEMYAALAREARRMGDTVDRLLGFGRMAAGRHVAVRAPVKLHEVIEQAIRDFGEDVERKLDPVEANVDAAQIRLALDNLLANARKYGAKPYAVRLAREGEHVTISVSDRGPGIPRRDRRRVFKPFERGDARLSSATEGSGIGLSLVAHVARAHDGEAYVEPNGNTITMRIRA
jgi:signal transduction histidine kinase